MNAPGIGHNVGDMRYVVTCALILALSGCAGQDSGFLNGLRGKGVRDAVLSTPDPAPESVTDGDPFETAIVTPDEGARTVEEFDTTTAADREAALAPAPGAGTESGDGRLGVTIASLGDPTLPGFWIKTPLVSEEKSGRIVYVTSGRSVQVTLIPSGGPVGGGSQVSLAAMRLLDAPLAGLPELVVYAN